MRNSGLFLASLLFAAAARIAAGEDQTNPLSLAGGAPVVPLATPAPEKSENTLNRFQVETILTLNSDFKDDRLGDGNSSYKDITFDHRFLITGNWYFRAGIEYERYDFGGSDNGLPDHLQASYGHLAIEYVVRDFPAVSLELDPGFYFQNRISSDAFDIPWKMYVTFPLKKDKIFGVVGLGGAIYQHPAVAPGGGLIWLFSDKLRLQGVFPKPAARL